MLYESSETVGEKTAYFAEFLRKNLLVRSVS